MYLHILSILLYCLGQLVVIQTGDGGRGQGVIVARGQKIMRTQTREWVRGRVLTAKHIVEQQSKIEVLYSGAPPLKSTAVPLEIATADDIAILDVYVPVDAVVADVGQVVTADTRVTLHVLDLAATDLRTQFPEHYTKTLVAATPTTETMLYADCTLCAGYSGGAVLDDKGRLVGIVSGGWFWFGEETKPKQTWPLRAVGGGPLRRLFDRHKFVE